MILSLCLTALITSLFVVAAPSISVKHAKRCNGTISSLSDVSNALLCTTVNIYGFTVPGGSRLNLALLDGTTVNLMGDITFGNLTQDGPLFQISGQSITFNGNGNSFDGGGPFYWDGQGSSAGTNKPRPMMKIEMSGTFSNTRVINSPAQAFSVSNPGPLTITGVTIDNSLGDQPNSQSNGYPAGRNTDGFDCSTTSLTIENSTVLNQDDCIAINKGSQIIFQNNVCIGGHGISIGSISSGATVSDITIQSNTIINNVQALRIKMDASASGSIVNNITYSGNRGIGIKRFGILIDQSYPNILGTPGTGVHLNDVNFVGATNIISVDSSATPIAINCGPGACTGQWKWTSLMISGGANIENILNNAPQLIWNNYTP